MAEISKVKIGKITRNALTIQKEFGKYLIIKSKKISKNIYNKIGWKILSKAFCTCVFYYILFSSVVGVDINQSEYITDRFMEVEGGSSEDGVSGGGGKKKKNKRR